MKIRIKGKGLPKAQMWNSQIGMPGTDWTKLPPPRIGVPSMQLTPEEEAMRPYDPTYPTSFGPLNTGVGPQVSQKERELQQAYQNDPEGARNYDYGVAQAMTSNYMSPNSTTSKKDLLSYNRFLGKKYKDDTDDGRTEFQNFAEGMQKLGNSIKLGVGVGSMLTDQLAASKRERDFATYRRNQLNSDALFKPVSGTRGDYVTTGSRFGEFRPDEYVVNRGMFAEQGGEYTQPMRIRITAAPMQSMEYGGQSNYGLDLGRRKVYTDMPETRSEMFNSTISAVPREMANIEAEGGETVYGDLDGDGGNEHMKITGPRHSQGGVPLNVPEGSFIFSDTAKMKIKDPEVLKYFGLPVKKGGYTPAEIAKRYDLNKYKAIIEDETQDELNKTTAQLMMKNYQDKLGKLSVVQESMKGFPQGIPQVAQSEGDQYKVAYGGYIPMAIDGFNYTFPPIDPYAGSKNPTPTGKSNKFNRGTDYLTQWESIIPGVSKLPNKEAQKKIYNYLLASDPDRINQMWQEYGLTNEGKKYKDLVALTEKDAKGRPTYRFNQPLDIQQLGSLERAYVDGMFGARQLDPSQPKPAEITTKYRCTENGVSAVRVDGPMASMQVGLFDTYEQALAVCQDAPVKTNPKPTDANQVGSYGNEELPFGYMTPDLVNMAAAAIGRPKKYLPYRSPINLPRVSPTFYDPNREIAAQNETANIMAQNAATFANPQAYMANAARLQGSLAEGVANTMGRTQNQNIQVANQFAGINADIIGKENMLAAQRANDLYDAGVIANQQYDNARRLYNRNLAASYAQAFDNRMKLGMLNAVNPMYRVDPRTGRSYYVRGYDPYNLGSNSGGAGAVSGTNFLTLKNKYLKEGYSESLAERKADQDLTGNRGRASYADNDMDGVPDRASYSMGMMPDMFSYLSNMARFLPQSGAQR